MQDICEKRLQIQLLSYLCSVKGEFGKICTVSFPIVFVTVFRIPLYEEQNFTPAYQFQSYWYYVQVLKIWPPVGHRVGHRIGHGLHHGLGHGLPHVLSTPPRCEVIWLSNLITIPDCLPKIFVCTILNARTLVVWRRKLDVTKESSCASVTNKFHSGKLCSAPSTKFFPYADDRKNELDVADEAVVLMRWLCWVNVVVD